MNNEPVDQHDEPITEEFEKLEFLPEQPEPAGDDLGETSEIIFTPEDESGAEPPISFNPPAESTPDLSFDPAAPPESDTPVSFELFGTSLFDDGDFEDEFDTLEPLDFDDDLEF